MRKQNTIVSEILEKHLYYPFEVEIIIKLVKYKKFGAINRNRNTIFFLFGKYRDHLFKYSFL